jgi:hypothetical protein
MWMQSGLLHSGQFIVMPPKIELRPIGVACYDHRQEARKAVYVIHASVTTPRRGAAWRQSDQGVLGPQEQPRLAPPIVEEPAPRSNEVVSTGPAERVEMGRYFPLERVIRIIESRQSPGVVVSEQSGGRVVASGLRAKSHDGSL